MDDKEEKKVVEETEANLIEKTYRLELDFIRDPEDKNWISKIPNGKTAILHRRCESKPQPGIKYNCTILEKESYALAYITGYSQYPRGIIRPDGQIVFLRAPNTQLKIYPSVYDVFKYEEDLEFLLMVLKEENRTQVFSPQSIETKNVDIIIKLTESGGLTAKKTLKIVVPITDSLDMILGKIINIFTVINNG